MSSWCHVRAGRFLSSSMGYDCIFDVDFIYPCVNDLVIPHCSEVPFTIVFTLLNRGRPYPNVQTISSRSFSLDYQGPNGLETTENRYPMSSTEP